MNTFVVLLRGINVGGRNPLPMKALAACLEELGCRDVQTYIQSGNVVLQSRKGASRLTTEIRQGIARGHRIDPFVLLLTLNGLDAAIAANPFPEAEADPTRLHLGFLDAVPSNPDLAGLEALKAHTERFRLIDTVFYLYAPDGVGRSKLASRSERLLGVSMTDRNWRTVRRLREMATALGR